jgi:hypothetical protein
MRALIVSVVAVLAVGLAVPAGAAVPKFGSCAKLLAKYPTGVARDDSVAAAIAAAGMQRPSVNRKVYEANRRNLDRDGDGVACEQTA